MYVKIYADGASRGNPGEAGAAAIAYDKFGNVLAKSYMKLGKATNNEAEYYSAYLALSLITKLELRLKIDEIVIYMDSLLVIKQLGGQYKVKAKNLKEIYDYCTTILHYFVIEQRRIVRFIHIPREENAIVDKFVNDCMNEG